VASWLISSGRKSRFWHEGVSHFKRENLSFVDIGGHKVNIVQM
jgi:hypothetical protein